MLFISAFRAYAFTVERNAAQGTTGDVVFGFEFATSRIDSAGKGDFCDVELIFKQLVNHFYHTFHGHGFLGHYQAAIGIRSAKFGFEGFAFHNVIRSAVFDTLLLLPSFSKSLIPFQVVFPFHQPEHTCRFSHPLQKHRIAPKSHETKQSYLHRAVHTVRHVHIRPQ